MFRHMKKVDNFPIEGSKEHAIVFAPFLCKAFNTILYTLAAWRNLGAVHKNL